MVQAFEGEARARGAAVVWGQAREGDTPLQLWARVLRAWVATRSLERVREQLGSDAAVIAQLVPDLGLFWPPVPAQQKPAQAPARLCEVVAGLFEQAATERPLVVVLDDLHWADERSLRVLQLLTRRLAYAPLLVVGIYRDGDVTGKQHVRAALTALIAEPTSCRIQLEGFPKAADLRSNLFQLPPDISEFTGRGAEAAQVRDLLDRDAGQHSTAVVISAIAGKGGVGKTTLAIHVAHQVRHRFPDGQLYVDLRGADAQPLDPAHVLAGFLHTLGVEPSALPDGLEQRAGLYRARLNNLRVLVVLDNAADEAGVRPLLPGSAGCAVLVTSRRRLAGLEGATTIDLDVMDPDQAIELLAKIAGPERVAAEPEAAMEVVRLCGCLPLAVRIAGARLAAKRHWRLASYEARLRDERTRLTELRVGDREVRQLRPQLQGVE
jgi:hypothetical protein